jgi:hypothetical protein
MLRIFQSLKEDGALERDDWLMLLPLFIKLVEKLGDAVEDKPFLMIGLYGVEKVLEQIHEHIEEMETP